MNTTLKTMTGTVEAVCRSDKKGPKNHVESIRLVHGHGIEDDVHAGPWHRQISLLSLARIEEMRETIPDLPIGAFGENIVAKNFTPEKLEVGRRVRAGAEAVLQITQLGKECHDRCVIFHTVGDCIMPKFGTFARVIRPGIVRSGDTLTTDPNFDCVRLAVVSLAGEDDAAAELVSELVGGLVPTCNVAHVSQGSNQDELVQTLTRLCDDECCDLVVVVSDPHDSRRKVALAAAGTVATRRVPEMTRILHGVPASTEDRAGSETRCVECRGSLIVNLSVDPQTVGAEIDALRTALVENLERCSGFFRGVSVLR